MEVLLQSHIQFVFVHFCQPPCLFLSISTRPSTHMPDVLSQSVRALYMYTRNELGKVDCEDTPIRACKHIPISLCPFFLFILESVRVHFCFSETANPEETVVPHTDGSIRIERMKEEEDEGSLLSLSATLTLLLDTVTLP